MAPDRAEHDPAGEAGAQPCETRHEEQDRGDQLDDAAADPPERLRANLCEDKNRLRRTGEFEEQGLDEDERRYDTADLVGDFHGCDAAIQWLAICLSSYGLLLAHVLLGVVQSERALLFPILCGAGCLVLVALHLLAARKEQRTDKLRHAAAADGYVEIAAVDELHADAGKVVVADGVRYALYVRKGRLFALSNVCRHQGGPIGEGRILNGCITCPWHGYQYRAEDGCSPPPFSEVLETYPLRIVEGKVFLSPVALPLETKSEGVPVENVKPKPTTDFPIGWQSKLPAKTHRLMKATVTALALLVPMAAGLCAWFFNPVDRGRFEFGNEKIQSGILYEQPVPRLRITSSDGVTVDHILVGAGKFGAGDLIKGADGREVSFTGTRIERKHFRMIEITRPETFRILNPHVEPLSAPAVSTLGEGEFTGELVAPNAGPA